MKSHIILGKYKSLTNFLLQDLLSKVRAMLKASREAVLKEDMLESQLPEAPPVPPLPDSDQEEGETDSS